MRVPSPQAAARYPVGSGQQTTPPPRGLTVGGLWSSGGLLLALVLFAGEATLAQREPPEGSESSTETLAEPRDGLDSVRDDGDSPSGQVDQERRQARTEMNLLGEVDTEAGESRRNENVQLTLVDNNVLKEINVRMGTTATIVREFEVSNGYFGTEFGMPVQRPIHLAAPAARRWHGEIHETHGNSVFSARSFFQVGKVQPARSNNYGVSVSVPLPRAIGLAIDAGSQRRRGNVNGNILMPRPDEREPLATDPATRAFVARILDSFPNEVPNRSDIDPRAHNTNAPQSIDNDTAGGRLDLPLGTGSRVALNYRFMRQRVDAFQLVKGQNPDTTTGSHGARATWSHTWSPQVAADLSIAFRRATSVLTQEESAIGPMIWTGRQLQPLGSPAVPFDRAQNFFRFAGQVSVERGQHRLVFGASGSREHLNGVESSVHGGFWAFDANFGRDTVTNIRMGTPTRFMRSIGSTHRGFRLWRLSLGLGDTWKLRPDLTLSFGLRYEPATRPTEVNGLSRLPYRSDWNNIAPQVGIAYRSPGMGVIRVGYGLSFGEIFTATYTQERYNPPGNILVTLVDPDLIDPLAGIATDGLDPSVRSSLNRFDPDLVLPYSHQYNASWEVAFSRSLFAQVGYVGSRTHRLLSVWMLNRARPVQGITLTTSTVNERRPDDRYFQIRHIVNGSRAYFDAGRVTVGIREWKGLSGEFSYWLSKAIDLGAHYANNATYLDGLNGQSQSEHEVHSDVKALSEFDQSHAATARLSYSLPSSPLPWRLGARVFGDWSVSAIVLLKTGTPFTILTGSDAPGFGNVDGASADRPHVVDPSVLGRAIDHPDTSTTLLPRSAFAYVGPLEAAGSIGRNTQRKDGIRNINVAVSREWTLRGKVRLLFRVASINLFNTPQFANPGNEVSGGNFGRITNTLNDGRTFSLFARLSF